MRKAPRGDLANKLNHEKMNGLKDLYCVKKVFLSFYLSDLFCGYWSFKRNRNDDMLRACID